jgi:hypothetical protein
MARPTTWPEAPADRGQLTSVVGQPGQIPLNRKWRIRPKMMTHMSTLSADEAIMLADITNTADLPIRENIIKADLNTLS